MKFASEVTRWTWLPYSVYLKSLERYLEVIKEESFDIEFGN
jgi:hypothetical protein